MLCLPYKELISYTTQRNAPQPHPHPTLLMMIVLIDNDVRVLRSPQELYYTILSYVSGRKSRFYILSTTCNNLDEFLTTKIGNIESYKGLVWDGGRYGPAFQNWEKYESVQGRLRIREENISHCLTIPPNFCGWCGDVEMRKFEDVWRCVSDASGHFKLPYEVSIDPIKQLVRVLKSAIKHFEKVDYYVNDESWILRYFIMSDDQVRKVTALLEKMRLEKIPLPHVSILDIIANFQRGLLKLKTSRFLKDSTPISEFARYCVLVRHGIFTRVVGSRYDLPLFWNQALKEWNDDSVEDRKRKMIGAVGVHRSWADNDEFKLFVASSEGSTGEDEDEGNDSSFLGCNSSIGVGDSVNDGSGGLVEGQVGLELIEEEGDVGDDDVDDDDDEGSVSPIQPAVEQANTALYHVEDLTTPSSKDTTYFDNDLTAVDDETMNDGDVYEESEIDNHNNVINDNGGKLIVVDEVERLNTVSETDAHTIETMEMDGVKVTNEENDGDDENDGEEDHVLPLPCTPLQESCDKQEIIMDLKLQTELLRRPGALTALLYESSSASSSVMPSEYENESESVENSPKLLKRVLSREESIPERIDRFEKLSGHNVRPQRHLRLHASHGDLLSGNGYLDDKTHDMDDIGSQKGGGNNFLKKSLKHFVKRSDDGVVDELRALVGAKAELVSLKSAPSETLKKTDGEKDRRTPFKTAKRGRSISEIFSALLDDNMKDLSSSAEYKNKIVCPRDLYNRMKISSDKNWEDLPRKTKEKYHGAFLRKYDDCINSPETCNIEMADILEIVRVCVEFGDVQHRIVQYAVNIVAAQEEKRKGNDENGINDANVSIDNGDAASVHSFQSLQVRKRGSNENLASGYGHAVMRRVHSDRM